MTTELWREGSARKRLSRQQLLLLFSLILSEVSLIYEDIDLARG